MQALLFATAQVSPSDVYASIQSMRDVTFELADGTTQTVDIKHAADHPSLYIRKLAADFAKDAYQFKWWVKSAYHKELRRGDFQRALTYNRWMEAALGRGRAKDYNKSIILEETRNVSLLESFGRSTARLTPDEVARAIIGSRKKWELADRFGHGCIAKYVAAYRATRSAPVPSEQHVRDVALHSTDYSELIGLCWAVLWAPVDGLANDPIRATWLTEPFFERAARVGGAVQRFASAVITPDLCHTLETFCELFSSVHDAQSDLIEPSNARAVDGRTPFLPYLNSYVFDNHTRSGWGVYKAKLSQLRPGAPQPEKMDIRWSGMTIGILWREYAFAQFGRDYATTPWERVEIPATVWSDCFASEYAWYSKMMP